jgi:serine/threonine-protein kinase HipA
MNIQRIEHATLALARRADLETCGTRLERVSEHDVLMVERFDHEWNGVGFLRRGLVSGLTLLDVDEGYVKWGPLVLPSPRGRVASLVNARAA